MGGFLDSSGSLKLGETLTGKEDQAQRRSEVHGLIRGHSRFERVLVLLGQSVDLGRALSWHVDQALRRPEVHGLIFLVGWELFLILLVL